MGPGQHTEAVEMEHEVTKAPAAHSEGGDDLGKESSAKPSESNSLDDILLRLAQLNEPVTLGKIPENAEDVRSDAVDSLYDYHCRGLLKRDRRLGLLDTRSWQANLHSNYTSLRIAELEKEVKWLKKRVGDLGDDCEFPDVAAEMPIHLHEIKRSNPTDFVLNNDTICLPTQQQPALEVRLPVWITPKQPPSDVERTSHKNGNPIGVEEVSPIEITPDRLRIRSRPLLFHLEQVTELPLLNIVGTDKVEGNRVYSSLVFLRPFRFFIRYETATRQSVTDVEAKVEEEQRKPPQKLFDAEKTPQEFTNNTLLDDLRLLITFLDTDLRPTFRLLASIKDGTAAAIEYADLRHLFTRGEIVILRTDQTYAQMVVNVAGGRELLTHKLRNETKEAPVPVDGFTIDCISLGSNGSSFVPRLVKHSIRRFYGARAISSLSIYPLKFDPKADALFARFRECGSHFADIANVSFCHKRAVGKTVDEPSINLDAEVIVDMTLAMNAKPEWRADSRVSSDDFTRNDRRETEEPPWCKHSYTLFTCCGSDAIFIDLDLEDIESEEFLVEKGYMFHPNTREELTDEHLLILRPYAHAFVLRSRQWVTIRSEDLQEVVFRNNFDDLVVPDNHKTTVKALVTTHENARSPHSSSPEQSSIGAALDLVKGKGAGLVILLHGPPGVGKTSTAECVADDTKRPLFPITCGDIGETASDVEHNLQKNFQLAHKWGCVLLLDEADIFLAKRTRSDLRHNAVTSVFLRSLEYYAGILFLTTNRVGAIDPAFRSRIQMSLFYPKLSLDVTCQLYMKFIRRAKAEQQRKGDPLFKIKEKEILKFGKKHFRVLEKGGYETWNGR